MGERINKPSAPARYAASHPGRALWLRWALAFILGELVGFAAAAAAGAVMVWALEALTGSASDIALIGVMVLAGSLEGATVGLAQWTILRRYIPHLTAGSWTLATIAGAAAAWAIGMTLAAVAAPSQEVAVPAVIGAAALLGAINGALLGLAQWAVLRRHVRRAGWWVAANAAGWALGMVVAFGGTGLTTESTPIPGIIAIWAVTGPLMAITPAAVTGLVLVRLLNRMPTGLKLLNTLGNPFVETLLRSPFHRAIGSHTMLISFAGRKSGKPYSVPVNYLHSGGVLTVLSSRDRTWWRNLRAGAPVRVRVAGRDLDGIATVATDGAGEMAEEVTTFYREVYHRTLTPAEAVELARTKVLVRIALQE